MEPTVKQGNAGAALNPEDRPDVMNDPAYDTNVKGKENNLEEPDTCRICRGEGSQEEPLFYPCKCSGSIKFVHQNCLMEWLSHSQKKHCELCKTPFHFTKLYHPHMPSTVPLPVFIRQATVHTWKSLVTSSRFLLVAFVWSAWLPWCMRTIWRGLFWIGDGGWANWAERRLKNESIAYELSLRLVTEGTTPVKQGLLMSKEATASALINQISNKLPRLIPPIKNIFSFSIGQPWGLALLKRMYYYAMGQSSGLASSPASTATTVTSHAGPIGRSPPSWLSDLQFLRTLTPSTMLNNLIIDTLEGQLITLFVVTAFILIFLIREWVVQQQPILNGGIDLDAEVAVAQNPEDPVPQQLPEQRRQAPEIQLAAEAADEGGQAQGPRARRTAIARPRRPRIPRQSSEQEGTPFDDGPADASEAEGVDAESAGSPPLLSPLEELTMGNASETTSNPPQRPVMPDRDTLARAAEIRRTVEEDSRNSGAQESAMEVYKDLWARAGKEPMEVIRIIEQEGRSNELAWIVAAMRNIEGLRQGSKSVQENLSSRPAERGTRDSTGSQPEDEGFIILNRPSLNASPEPQHDPDVNMGTSSQSGQKSFVPNPVQPGSLQSQAEAPQSHSEHSSSPSSPPAQSTTPRGSKILDASIPEVQTAESQSGFLDPVEPKTPDSPVTLNDSNPFHQDFEGTLPEASTYPHIARLAENNFFDPPEMEAEADQTSLSTNGASENQTQPPPAREMPQRPKTLVETFTDWLWGGVATIAAIPEQPVGDDEHVVNNIAEEAPFVPIDHGQPLRLAANDRAVANQDPEVVAAAIQAGIDPNEAEAVDEIEDLEGILELVGMQGPLAGLVQNGMFCACLVSLTILFGVWIPYISGKIFLVLLAHPFSLLFRIPLRWASSTADMIIDIFTFCAGCVFFWTNTVISILFSPMGWLVPSLGRVSQSKILAETAKSYAEGALERLAMTFVATGDILSKTDIPMFSVLAHESLRSIETRTAWVLHATSDQIAAVFKAVYNSPGVADSTRLFMSSIADHARSVTSLAFEQTPSIMSVWPSLLEVNPLRVNLGLPPRTIPLDYDLAYWNIKDRALAVVFGYLFFAVLGVAHIHLTSWLKGTNKAGRVTGGVADGLYQAGGVMKVILIISIEMIVFPLYCGLLLDVALLPLFGDVTVLSRIDFTLASPNTSLFVHWFAGTCYMFHFALFVSMCRKILRSGVLYFIRDPDDPTFHPVRDVLERSVSTQLWKISFSALVYGGLVIVCLGGVVWGIARAFDGVLPIYWSSNEPVLEFPVDLLFYNFLMPLAVQFLKPSKGLNSLFNWWFRNCGRALRLTDFLFGEKRREEEGARHVRHTWTDLLNGNKGDVHSLVTEKSQPTLAQDGDLEAHSRRDGRYVRAPGSDQVRIPKGAHTFLEVDEQNNRVDGQPDSDEGIHGRKNEMFTQVYVPPYFRLRISAFILLIWLFAAATGISMTLVPLVFGRFIFAKVAPDHLRMNDIYAFSIGVYILGGALYGILHHHHIAKYVRDTLTPHTTTIGSFLHKSATLSLRLLGLLYTYTAFGILLPALLSLLMEFYFIIPLHTYFSTSFTSFDAIQSERHVIHLIQDWTLGVLYLKMAARLILWNTPSRPASALRAIVRDGWLNPDVQLATRGFIIPAILTVAFALVAPLALGWLANATILHSYSANDDSFSAYVYRYSYPGVLGLGMAAGLALLVAKAFTGWRKKVRDEVYLIGERLHNFGESKRRKGAGKGKGKALAGQG